MGSQNGSWPSDSYPPDERLCRYLELLHSPETDEGSRSSKTSFAMNGDGPGIFLAEMLIGHFKELIHYVVWWCRSVNEKQIIVRNLILQEVLSVILLLVKSDDTRNAKLLKYFNVLFGVVAVALVGISLLDWSHEGHKLAGNNPVDVAVLNALVELILLHVEGSEVVPLELDRILQSLQALEHRALVQTVSLACIPIGLK